MKKIISKIVILLLIAVMTVSFTACGDNGGTGGGISEDGTLSGELKILILNRGYGVAWCKEMAKAFEAKYEGVTVKVDEAVSVDSMSNYMKQGSKKNDYDLFFNVNDNQSAALVSSFSGVEGGVHNLNTLYDTKIPGENVTLGEKMNQSVREELLIDGNYYTVPWATSTLGINYNETVLDNVFGKGNWEVPNTTDELLALASSYQSKYDQKFLLYGSELDLIGRTLFLGWWGQYEGLENYNRFCNGEYYDPEEDLVLKQNKGIYSQTGRLRSLEVIQDLVNYKNGYADSQAVANLDGNTYKDYQGKFYASSYNYAIYPCGDWLEEESSNKTDCVVKMMKLPVISSITEKLEDKSMTDETLSAVVAAIDNGETSYEGVSDNDFARIKEARNTSVSMSNFHIGYIPEYSNAITLAEQFILYMASDEGISIFKKNALGGFLPYDFDYENMEGYTLTDYEKSVSIVNKDANFVYYTIKNPVFYKGGALFYLLSSGAKSMRIDEALHTYGKSNTTTGMSAQEIYEYFIDYYNAESGSRWDLVVKKSS